MISVRIAHAELWPGRPASDAELADDPDLLALKPPGPRLGGFLVVLADDAGHRALAAWLAEDPWATALPALLDRPDEAGWTMAGLPEEFAARLLRAAGTDVAGVEIYPVTAAPGEVGVETFAARIELDGRSGTAPIPARLDLGLALAVAMAAPVRVADAVMDRLAVPVPGEDLLAPFRRPPAEQAQWSVVVDRGAGRVLHVPDDPPGRRPRFEPRNMAFGDGLDRWELEAGFGEEAGPGPDDYSAAAEGPCAVLSSAVPEPRGSAVLVQEVFAEDFRGAPVLFGGEIRAEDAAARAGLCLEVLEPGWRAQPDRALDRVVTGAAGRDWSRQQIIMRVPENAEVIRFGVVLAGRGAVWLRNPELRHAAPDEAEQAGGG
jgi:hypothetical protein